jgi:5-methylcytosine-specific restriction endonuclease McrA
MLDMKTKEKVVGLRKQGKTIPEICFILNIKKGTVGFHLKNSNIRIDRKHSESTKQKISEALKNKPKVKHKNGYKKYIPVPKNQWKKNQEGYINPKSKDYWSILKGEEQSIGTYHNNIRGVLKRFIIKNNIIPYICSECGCDDNWRGKKMSLILDHINGINNDNKLENLRFLCPNCDSIQDTYKGKNKNNGVVAMEVHALD